MSVIVRNRCGVGNSYKGFPTEDINILSKYILSNTLHIKFEDPEDSIKDGITLSAWKGTILVYKEGSYPTSPTDGTVLINSTTRNAYKNTEFTRNISSNNTLYFRFYTYNTDKVYNDSSSMMFTLKNINADPVLANNSWETINQVSESGIASEIWSIGDEIIIPMTVNTANNPIDDTFQIWDFNHFDKTDGSGKAGILFGSKYAPYSMSMDDGPKSGGWPATLFRRKHINQVPYSYMPSDVKAVIKEVVTSSNAGSASSANKYDWIESNDILFLPSLNEIFDVSSKNNYDGDYGSKKLPIFTDTASRIKYEWDGTTEVQWWTRSPVCGSYSDFYDVDGDYALAKDKSFVVHYALCFNV